MKRSEKEMEEIHAKWINDISKRHSLYGIKRHIIRHAKDISVEKPWIWSASMMNLVEIYNAKLGNKTVVRHKIDRLVQQRKRKKRIRTQPPEKFDIDEWDCMDESKKVYGRK